MFEIGDYIRLQDGSRRNATSRSLGLHVQRGTRHLNGRDTGEPIAWFVGSVPSTLAYVDGATDEQIEKARRFGARFGPAKRYFPSKDAAWAEAERQGFKRCDKPECSCNK